MKARQQIKDLGEDVATEKGKLADMERAKAALEEELAGLKETSGQTIAHLEERVQKEAAEKTSLEGTINQERLKSGGAEQKQIQELREKVSELEGQLQQSQAAVAEAESQVKSVPPPCGTADGQEEVVRLKEEVAGLKKQLEEAQIRRKDSKADASILETEADSTTVAAAPGGSGDFQVGSVACEGGSDSSRFGIRFEARIWEVTDGG